MSDLIKFDAVIAADSEDGSPYSVINLGTGRGVTVREMVDAFEQVYGQEIKKVEKPPRPGDVAGAYANANKARYLLNWIAEKPIEKGIEDALRWREIREEILDYGKE
ncbi:MAG: hypothetical protein ACOCYU_06315 [Brevefilum sp.]